MVNTGMVVCGRHSLKDVSAYVNMSVSAIRTRTSLQSGAAELSLPILLLETAAGSEPASASAAAAVGLCTR